MPETVKVTFRIVGPLKRSIFQKELPDPAEEAINDILHWSWSTRLQMRRFRQSLGNEFKALDAQSHVRSRRRFSGTSYDVHILLVAAANLSRALKRAPKIIRPAVQVSESSRRALWLLRNIYEHWDDFRSSYRSEEYKLRGAAQKLLAEFPNADPWSFTFDPASDRIVIADVVPLEPLLKELQLLEMRLLRLERRREMQGAKAAAADNK